MNLDASIHKSLGHTQAGPQWYESANTNFLFQTVHEDTRYHDN